MPPRVVLHIGVPKSGTTFLQDMLWKNRGKLRGQGVLVPSDGRQGRHVRASAVVRATRGASLPDWELLRDEVASWPGTAVFSQEGLGAATADQARRVLTELAPAVVELVVTARDFGALHSSVWQQRLKRGLTSSLETFTIPDDDGTPWSWRGLDPAEVLDRWARGLPRNQVHVVVNSRNRTVDELWDRFAGLIGVEPAQYDTSAARQNIALSAPAAELTRRVVQRLGPEFAEPRASVSWIKRRLVERAMTGLPGAQLQTPPGVLPALRDRAQRSAARLEAAGYHILGDLDDLVPGPPQAPPNPPASDRELLDAATDALAALLRAWREEREAAGPLPTRGRARGVHDAG